MGKAPSFQFYVKDWLSDPQLKMASFTTKGIWIDMICYMWAAPEQGKLTGTANELSKLLGATEPEMKDFISDCQRLMFADVQELFGNVTVINRRMNREWKDRESARLRMQRMRGVDDPLQECSGNVPRARAAVGDKDIDFNKKTKYLECVFLTDEQHKKLFTKFGKAVTEKAIFILNNYIMQKKSDPYVSHYHVLLGWPTERVMEKAGGDNGRGKGNSSGRPGVQTTPPEWTGTLSAISEEQRQANIAKLKALGCGVDED